MLHVTWNIDLYCLQSIPQKIWYIFRKFCLIQSTLNVIANKKRSFFCLLLCRTLIGQNKLEFFFNWPEQIYILLLQRFCKVVINDTKLRIFEATKSLKIYHMVNLFWFSSSISSHVFSIIAKHDHHILFHLYMVHSKLYNKVIH